MGVFTDHPHTAITDTINNIITSPHLDPEIELPSLLNLIKLQYSGPTEAARAMRKKLKYGTVKEELKSLDLLNCIVCNGGKDMTEIYNDRKLLQQLRDMSVNTQLDKSVRVRVINMAIFWHNNFEEKYKYYKGVVDLKSRMPDYERKIKKQQKNIDFMNDEAIHDDEQPHTNAALNKKYKIPKINLEAESPRIKLLIAESTTCSINLTNSLHTLSANQHPSTDDKTQQNFEKARVVRRKILRYLQLVDSEEFLGSLIHANEELVSALKLYTECAERVDGDSDDDYFDDDDDDEEAGQRYPDVSEDSDSDESTVSDVGQRRPPSVVDVNDPFGDSHAVDEAANWR